MGLSSWYRLDVDEVCLKLDTPEKLADCWLTTLRSIEEDGLLDTILYVDLCNEWPGDSWAPFSLRYTRMSVGGIGIRRNPYDG